MVVAFANIWFQLMQLQDMDYLLGVQIIVCFFNFLLEHQQWAAQEVFNNKWWQSYKNLSIAKEKDILWFGCVQQLGIVKLTQNISFLVIKKKTGILQQNIL